MAAWIIWRPHAREISGARLVVKIWEEELKVANQTMAKLNTPVPDWADLFLAKQQEMFHSFKQNLELKLEQRFEELNKTMKEIEKDTKAMTSRMTNTKKRIRDVEEKQNSQEEIIIALIGKVRDLKTKLSYMESYSRRNNLLLVGLKEGLLVGKEAGGEPAAILRYILDQTEAEAASEVDRHHRSLCPHPDPQQPQKPYVIGLLRWEDWQLIWSAAMKKGRLELKGKALHVFQDFSAEIQRKHAEYA